ncbi:MAG: hypothetical protein ACXVII_45310, partial [Solirubrobacteraceae bacterium]
ASLELIRLLRSTGAHVEALEPTVREMGGILAVYEDRVRTSQGRESLYRTELTRHILSQRLSPSDIRIRAATLRDELVKLGINVKEPPERARTWTWDERKLGEMLSDRPGGESQARVVHDVDCVAAVLTYRRGRTSSSLDEMGTVFVTTSPMTVQNTVAWYRDEGGVGLPPIVHYIALSNAAWLKNPGSVKAGRKVDHLRRLKSGPP